MPGAPPPAEQLVAALGPDYSFGRPTACRLIQDGLNTHYLIEAPEGPSVLRLYRNGWRSAADIGYELAVLDHLRTCGVPVCGPIARRDGGYESMVGTEEGPRTAVLFQYAAGQPPEVKDPDALRACGRTMALIHGRTEGFSCTHQRFHLDLEHLIVQPLTVILPMLAPSPEDTAFVQNVAQALQGGLAEQVETLEWGFCHGDFHGGNLRLDADGTLRVFDFDCGGLGWRAYDLAVCRLFCQEEAVWEGFCRAYREVRPLTDATVASIPWFLVARQLWRVAVFATHWPRLMGREADEAFFGQHLAILRERIGSHLPQLLKTL